MDKPEATAEENGKDVLLKPSKPIHGFDEVHAQVVRVGGNSPTVTLTFLNGQTGTYQIRGTHPKSLTKRIAEHLYDKVKLQVEAWWNAKTLEIENLYVLDLLEWQEVHLAQVYRENDERLPIALTFNSVEELLAEREKDRRR